MSRKLFYFVRHGESLLNAESIRQGSEGSLSEKGKEQAEGTAARLADRPFEVILASPYTRTKETANIINHILQKSLEIEYSPLLQERRNPSEIIGKSMKDPEVARIIDLIDKSYHSDDYRFSDEENFQDLKARAKAALDYLQIREEKNILVVSHGIFIRMIAAYILYGEALTASDYNLMSFLNASNNAAITVCEYKKPWFKDATWNLIAWDDYIHDPKNRSRGI
ncbi:MAG: histidine phosphatase family protein [bacterium]|nr:histidine phosphatase family protein [bacterium]